MAGYPEPEPGLVISYSYLWSDEAAQGSVEGRKDRPCAIVMALQSSGGDPGKPVSVAVVPVTHTPPRDPNIAIEIPPRVKQHLGLDSDRSWIVVDEINTFIWPGYDLRPIKARGGQYHYGLLPPKLFNEVIAKITELQQAGEITRTSRDDPAPTAA
jgi:hypothetical protein